MSATLKSRLPTIAATLRPRVGAAVKTAAEGIAQHAKTRVSVDQGDLQGAIHVEREGPASYYVIAGNDDVFYGHMVEHGTAKAAGQPFLVPAAEDGRAEAVSLVAAVLAEL